MLRKILTALALVVLGLVSFILSRPDSFRIVRSATIAAPAEVVFPMINDLHNWTAWSPWAELDPNMKLTYSGAQLGVGAVYSWTGNDKVGEGRMTILESQPNDKVVIKLEFMKPFEATNTTNFIIKPENGGVNVTWDMTGNNNFMSKAATLVMDMDKEVGGDFAKGLAKLKTVAEAKAKSGN